MIGGTELGEGVEDEFAGGGKDGRIGGATISAW